MANKLSAHRIGLAGCVACFLLLSPDALILRLVSADVPTLLLFRGALVALTLGCLIVLRRYRRVSRIAWPSRPIWVASILFIGTNIAFVTSIRQTDAASVLVILSAGPLWAAVFSRVFLGEHVPIRTWIACLAVVAGLALLLSGSIGRGDPSGDVVALIGSLCFAGFLTAVRKSREAEPLQALVLGGAMTALVGVALGADPHLPQRDLVLLAVLCLGILPASLALLTAATRFIPAPEVSLVSGIETLLGPLWVWVVLDEVPAPEVVIGGAIVVITAAIHSILGLREERETTASTSAHTR